MEVLNRDVLGDGGNLSAGARRAKADEVGGAEDLKFAAVLENYRTENADRRAPEALRPYLNGREIIERV